MSKNNKSIYSVPKIERNVTVTPPIGTTPPLPTVNSQVNNLHRIDISYAIGEVSKQMLVSGNRERTVKDYVYHFKNFTKFLDITYLDEISPRGIYNWLDSMNVAQTTKQSRLKMVKAFLTRCADNGWFASRFWSNIRIKIDKQIKPATVEADIVKLLQLLDPTRFVGLRDSVAIKTLFKTGVRITTLINLKETHIDWTSKELIITGDIMKNHKPLRLPLDDELLEQLSILIQVNQQVKQYYKQSHDYLFVTERGLPMNVQSSCNPISKQLHKYSKKYGLPNINAHSLRRLYATNLLNKGANIALISKALGHSDLKVTTQYLSLDVHEVSQNLREFL